MRFLKLLLRRIFQTERIICPAQRCDGWIVKWARKSESFKCSTCKFMI